MKRTVGYLITCLLGSVLLWSGCGGLITLELPPPRDVHEEDNWLTLGRNPQHQHYVDQNIRPPLAIVWKTNVKSVVTDHPLAIGDYILAPTRSGLLYAIDYETGTRVSSGKIGPALSHSPTLVDHVMFAGLNLGKKTLLSFDLQKTQKQLEKQYPQISTSPLISDDKIYFGTLQKKFFCANRRSGDKIWEFQTRAPIRSSPALQPPAVVFADEKGWLYALDVSSGLKLWEVQLSGNIFSHVVLDDSMAYIGTVTGNFYAVKLRNGKISWEITVPGAIYSSPALYGNTLYLGHNAREVLALDKRNGKVLWRFATQGIVNTVPLAAPDYLYVTSWDKHLYVLNRFTGEEVFKMKFNRPPKSSPIIYRDYLLIHTANDKLYALANERLMQVRNDKKRREQK